ncbi:hypothetical protein CDL12_01219 [Handroanthus impetiginosus]|uniref:Uncharacterized protein n=1 Tax=Handroanthus impetiginosus TaxID=429701 RepID=A0A2G9I8F1_9LAMI|nr:hypothetical protein CDL12_01219 [Handroanthus impetiginosus]
MDKSKEMTGRQEKDKGRHTPQESDIFDVSGVVLLVSSCGHSMSDAPTVQIWVSNKIDKEETSRTGKWDLQSLIKSSSELCGPEKSFKDGKMPRHVKFAFRNPVRCRIIWMTLRLPRLGSNSVNFERDFAQLSRRASFGGEFDSDPCIHAKRILLVERAVQIQVERLIDNDLVLEQFLSPASPMLAGFRFDGFSAIKHRVNHSPSTDADMLSISCLTCHPELIISFKS